MGTLLGIISGLLLTKGRLQPFNEKLDAVNMKKISSFLLNKVDGMPIPEILKMSSKASSIAVIREGAVPSIPYRSEVMESPAQI